MLTLPDTDIDINAEPETLEEALALISYLRDLVTWLIAVVDQEQAVVKALRRNSTNSSQAPSQDKPGRVRR